MAKSNRKFTYFLIFLFGFLSVKNLLLAEAHQGNCHEFGHIHMTELHDVHTGWHTHQKSDEDCHEGKYVFDFSILPIDHFQWLPINHGVIHEVIANLESNVASPILEPERKPPRI